MGFIRIAGKPTGRCFGSKSKRPQGSHTSAIAQSRDLFTVETGGDEFQTARLA